MQVDTLPHWIGPLHYLCAMPEKVDIKAVLWRNLNTLMAQQWGGENLTRLAREAGFAPATATRLKNQETSIGIDILEQLAAVFKVDAWQLLYRGLDASLAGDAARMFDQIDDPAWRRAVYAKLTQIAEFGAGTSSPAQASRHPTAEPAPASTPSQKATAPSRAPSGPATAARARRR